MLKEIIRLPSAATSAVTPVCFTPGANSALIARIPNLQWLIQKC